MLNQTNQLQTCIDTGFVPIGLDMPYRIVVGNSPMNWVDPYGEIPLLAPVVVAIVVYGGWEAYNAWNNFIEKNKQRLNDREEYLNYITQDKFDEGIALEKCRKANESLKQTLRSIPDVIQATPGHSAKPVPTSKPDIIIPFLQDLIPSESVNEN